MKHVKHGMLCCIFVILIPYETFPHFSIDRKVPRSLKSCLMAKVSKMLTNASLDERLTTI